MADLEMSQFTNGNVPTDTNFVGGYKDANTIGGNRRWSFANVASYVSTKLSLGTIVTQDADSVDITGGTIGNITYITGAPGSFISPTNTPGDNFFLAAWDVDGITTKTFAELISDNTPSLAFSQPAGGLLTWDGGVIGGVTPAAGTFTALQASDIVMATGGGIGTDTTNGHTATLRAYDVDGAAYANFGIFMNGNTPSLRFVQPSGSTLTWEEGAIGGVTPISIRGYRPSEVTFSGTVHTLALADAEYFQICSNALTQVITIPANASIAFPLNAEIDFFQQGAGQVTFVGDVGVTVQSAVGVAPKIDAQFGKATLKKIDTDTWCVFGDIAA